MRRSYLPITHKFDSRARESKRRSNFVILSEVFEAKDLTKPDRGNPNESVEGGCQHPFPSEKGGRLLRERHGVRVRFAVCCEVLHSADSVQDDKLLSAGSLLNLRGAKMWVMERVLCRFRMPDGLSSDADACSGNIGTGTPGVASHAKAAGDCPHSNAKARPATSFRDPHARTRPVRTTWRNRRVRSRLSMPPPASARDPRRWPRPGCSRELRFRRRNPG